MTEPVLWIRSALYTWQVGGSGFAAVNYWSSSQDGVTDEPSPELLQSRPELGPQDGLAATP